MKQLICKVFLTLVLLLTLTGMTSCSKEKNPDGPENPIPENIRRANEFIYQWMDEAYLWNSKIPDGIDPQQEPDPKAMLDRMIYQTLDKWTYVTDDAKGAMNEFQGISTTFGYAPVFWRFSNSDKIFGIIKYVVAGSPAEKAGLKRGDILLNLNGGSITESNYRELVYGKTITLETGIDEANVIKPSGKKYTLTAVEMYEDPVNTYKVIDTDGKKVGYLAYTGYVAKSHEKLDKIFTEFKQAGVSEMVLDLRYNPGGDATTPPYLGSFLAPEAVVKAGGIFLKETWNADYMAYYQQKGEDLNAYFNKNAVANLNLSRVFILTTSGTASASEATISGLKPYLNVILIGTRTHGKYCGAALLQPVIDNKGTLDPLINNWLLSMVIYKFVNKDGFTDFKDGIEVKYEVADDLFNAYPFGDPADPHLAKALEVITGVTKAAPAYRRSTLREGVDYQMLPELTDQLRKDYGNTKVIDIRML